MRKLMRGIYVAVVLMCFTACDDDDDNDSKEMLAQTDDQFVEKAARGNHTEVDFGRLAVDNAQSELVKSFAQQMVTEHGAAQQELKTLANNFDDIDWSEQLDASHEQMKQHLMTLSGREFDSAYMTSQVADHQTTVDLFDNEIENGSNPQVKAYANKYHPHIQHHLERADSILNVVLEKDHDGNGRNQLAIRLRPLNT